MAPDSVSSIGGATASSDPAATTTSGSRTTTTSTDATFGEAMKVAQATASRPPQGAGTLSPEALARAKQLGLSGGAGAYDVLGHRYARIEGGTDDGRYVNTSGNGRTGQTFEIVKRGGNTFHVYADHVVRVGPAATPPAASAPAPTETAGGTAVEDDDGAADGGSAAA